MAPSNRASGGANVRSRPRRWSAPATVFVAAGLLVPLAILFRYSLNEFVPGSMMVEALTLDELRQVLHRPLLHRRAGDDVAGGRACHRAICLVLGFPLAYVLARTQSRFKNLLIMLVVLPLFVGNAVRAAGWMTAVRHQGLAQRDPDAARR